MKSPLPSGTAQANSRQDDYHLWTGGSPQSYWVHIPSSRINRQYAHRRSQRWLAFNSATERHTVRSELVQPSAWSLPKIG